MDFVISKTVQLSSLTRDLCAFNSHFLGSDSAVFLQEKQYSQDSAFLNLIIQKYLFTYLYKETFSCTNLNKFKRLDSEKQDYAFLKSSFPFFIPTHTLLYYIKNPKNMLISNVELMKWSISRLGLYFYFLIIRACGSWWTLRSLTA